MAHHGPLREELICLFIWGGLRGKGGRGRLSEGKWEIWIDKLKKKCLIAVCFLNVFLADAEEGKGNFFGGGRGAALSKRRKAVWVWRGPGAPKGVVGPRHIKTGQAGVI